MTSSQLNPSQHVERIREILIGRDLQHMHGRLSRIEGALEKESSPQASSHLHEAITKLHHEQTALRQEFHALKNQPAPTHQNSLTAQSLGSKSDFASEMVARIDARIDAHFREILSHLQKELLKIQGQLNEELSSLKTKKADRSELANRFARLASAAMEKQDSPESKDYLL